MPYLSYKLSLESQKKLLEMFPPKYPCVKYEHITLQMCKKNAQIPSAPRSVQVIGMADDGVGLQVFFVHVDGCFIRPTDGLFWHITGSFDSSKNAPLEFDFKVPEAERQAKPYRPVTSNGFLIQLFDSKGNLKPLKKSQWKVEFFDSPIEIQTHPVLQFSSCELNRKEK